VVNHRRTVRVNRAGDRIAAGLLAALLASSSLPAAWAQATVPAPPGAVPPAGPPPAGPTATPGAPTAPPAAQPTAPPAATTPPTPPSAADLAAAKKHYAEGEKRFKAGDFAGSLPEFQAANDVKATPQAERYLGLAEDALGHYAAAVEWFGKFLAHVPDKMGPQADEIKKRDAEIRAMPGKVHVVSNPPGAVVLIDDKPQASVAPLDVDLPPGAHTFKFSAAGRLPAEKSADVTFASTQTLNADLDPEPPPPPPPPVAATPPPPPAPPPPPPEPRSKVPAFVTGGLAIVAAGVGTAFGIIALNDKSKFDKNPTTQTADDGDTHSLIADMAFGVAITFGVTSAVLFLTKDEPPPANASASHGSTTASRSEPKKSAITIVPTPFVGPHEGGAGFVMQF
jgi:hypothetical protein